VCFLVIVWYSVLVFTNFFKNMNKTIKKIFATVALATFSPVLSATIVFADEIYNTLDVSIDASAENVAMTVGGGSANVQMAVNQINGDDKNGCNFTGSNVLTVSVTSSNPAFATVSPSVLTFTSCSNAGQPSVVVTPVSAGVATITLTQITNTTLGTFNLTPATFTVTVSGDSVPPVLTLPSNMTAEATSASGATVTYTASATDANPANPLVTCNHASGSVFPLGLTTVSCSATDANSNTATGSFTVNIIDTTSPTISATPSNVSMEATGPLGRIINYTNPTAIDLVDGAVVVMCTPASGSMFPLGDTTVICAATDAHSNTSQSTFHVLVHDTTGPSLVLPATLTVEATGPAGAAVSFSPTASDIVSGILPVTCAPSSGSVFAITTTSVACSATDGVGNTSNGSFDVIVRDTTAPLITTHADITVEATGPTGAVAHYDVPVATDIVDGTVVSVCIPASGAVFPLGDTTITCTATDAHTNASQSSFVVHVTDMTPPVFTSATPSDMNVEATGPTGAVAVFTSPTAADLVDTNVNVVCESVNHLTSGSFFPLGDTLVTCTATDDSGNFAVSEFTVTVADTLVPIVVCGPADTLWHDDNVAIACTALDSGSGLVIPLDSSFNLTTNVPANTEDANASTGSREVCDIAGNCVTAGPIIGNKIDRKDPTITLINPIAIEYTIHQIVNANYTCSDSGSGILFGSCIGTTLNGEPIDTSSIGMFAFTVSASDVVGHIANSTANYTVGGYNNFSFKSPITLSFKDFKKTSTIPVKFSIKNKDGSYASQAVARLLINDVPAVASGSSNTGNYFRYDASAGQYIFNLSTKVLPTIGSYTLKVLLDDGTTKTQVIVVR
jgi:hypothetical protein